MSKNTFKQLQVHTTKLINKALMGSNLTQIEYTVVDTPLGISIEILDTFEMTAEEIKDNDVMEDYMKNK